MRGKTRMRIIFPFLLSCCALLAQDAAYLVLQKGASSLGYYSSGGKMLTAVPVGQHPHEMVFSRDGKYLYTTDNGTMRIEQAGKGGNSISIIDVKARKKIGDIVLGDYHRPHGIDIDPASGRLAVTTELPDQLLLIDPEKRSIVKKFDTKGKTSHMVKFGPGAKWAYVSNSSSGNVAAVNLDSGEVKLIQTGTRPEGSVLSKDGRELYVANREGASITVIDTSKQQAIANISTGKGPVRLALTPDGKTLVYALMHDKRVAFADPGTRRETGHVIVPGLPVSCSVSPDGKVAFASTEETDTVYMISIADKKIIGEIKTAKRAGPDPVFAMPR
jgi:YVTN family beta-propeller protein